MSSSILIVDDSPLICEVISQALADFNCEIIRTSSGEQAIELMRAKNLPDIVLLDVILPDHNGYEVCRIFKQNPLTASIPVIFITSFGDSKSIVNGFDAGGVDYISKPFSRQELRARVKAHLTNKQLADNMRVLNENLSAALLENRRLASEDPLTKLFNRRFAYESILRRFSSASGHELGILLADIDNFKAVNDTYGHSAGDYVLCKIADIIKQCSGKKGIACRWGGEEFLVALSGSASRDAASVAERICEIVRNTAFSFNKTELKCSITVGVVTAQKGETFETALQNADKALYDGKTSGKNKIVIFNKNKKA